MKVNFNETFKNWDGNDSEQAIKDMICKSLFSASEGLSADDKLMAYNLNLKIIPCVGETDITTEEASLIKKVCEKSLTAGGYGQIVNLIEGRK